MAGASERRESMVTDARALARTELGRTQWTLETLVMEFADPRDAYVYSPQPVSLRQLAAAYAVLRGDAADVLMAEFRARQLAERWTELRNESNGERTRAATKAVVDRTAGVVAGIATDVMMEVLGNRLKRYRDLQMYFDRNMTTILTDTAGEDAAGFEKPMVAAAIELRQLEASLLSSLPETGLTEAAQQYFSAADMSTGPAGAAIASLKTRAASLFASGRPQKIMAAFEAGEKRSASGSDEEPDSV